MSKTTAPPPRLHIKQLSAATERWDNFTNQDWAPSSVMLACAILSLLLANGPWDRTVATVWHTLVDLGTWAPRLSLEAWINDGLMTVFFFVMGLEIKREVVEGELSSPRQAAFPIAAALGGMLVPALIYRALNPGGSPGAPGWGVPMSTDMAFALGVVTLLGPRVPFSLKIFLTALAIVDDLGAILVIALFYTSHLSWDRMLGALGIIGALLLVNRYRRPLPRWAYVPIGLILWLLLLPSGVHVTIAGVLLAMVYPVRRHEPGSAEDVLMPWVSWFILPLFALVNAGVRLAPDWVATLTHPISAGIFWGLWAGKPLGITATALLAHRLKLAEKPKGVGWMQVFGVTCLGGIGFTMALFVATLAFPDAQWLGVAKMAILLASLSSGVLGFALLRTQRPTLIESPPSQHQLR